jgi:hypothetical protein
MYYKRPYCPDCKLIWGKDAIFRVTKCNKCGVSLILKDFNPYKKSLLGILIIGAGCLTFFIKEFPILWIGGFLWGISIIVTAFQNWERIRKLDGDIQERKFGALFDPIRTFINRRKFTIINCINCEQKLRVPKIRRKLKITCPKCRDSFTLEPAPFIKRIINLCKR